MFDKFEDLYPVKNAVKIRRDGEFMLVMGTDAVIQYLNETAAFMYEHFDGMHTVGEVYDLMLTEYDISPEMFEEVKRDIVNTIRDLQWQRVVELRRKKAA